MIDLFLWQHNNQ